MPRILILALVALLLPASLGPALGEAQVPLSQDSLWLVPSNIDPRPNALANAMENLQSGDAEPALLVLKKFSGNATVGAYVRLHQGQAELALGDDDAAAKSAEAVLKTDPKGYLREQALWLAADAAEARDDYKAAAKALSALTEEPLVAADMARAHLRLGLAAQQSDRRETAVKAFTYRESVHVRARRIRGLGPCRRSLGPTAAPGALVPGGDPGAGAGRAASRAAAL
jgi:tetratricopeptide (TPR) repeat protein